MNRRAKALQSLDRALLGAMMLVIAFVSETALNRMMEHKPAESSNGSRLGQSLIKRLLPGFSAHVRHEHPHSSPANE